MTPSSAHFTAAERDMRHFLPNTSIDEQLLQRLLQAAHSAPSVGLMQPWRFIRVRSNALRQQIAAMVDEERLATAQEMALCSAACAIQNLWLASRAGNLGMGWVSLFDPQRLAETLLCPAGTKPMALLCLGPVQEFYARPMLEQLDWRQGKALSAVLMEDSWQGDKA